MATVITETCAACGDETTEWVSVLWQREKGLPHAVQPVTSDAIRTWCVPCGTAIEPFVRRAVTTAALGGA